MKAGPNGACWSDGGGEAVHAPTQPVEAIDTTGAGDAFAAGFLAAHSAGADPHQALREANALAAIACRQIGGRPPPGLLSLPQAHPH